VRTALWTAKQVVDLRNSKVLRLAWQRLFPANCVDSLPCQQVGGESVEAGAFFRNRQTLARVCP
jgi:hypothetical protein